MVPRACIVCRFFDDHTECLKCGIEIFVVPVHYSDLFEGLTKVIEHLYIIMVEFYSPEGMT